MTRVKLRKLVIVLSSVVALSGGFGIEAAYARGGGGGGHGGFGGHMGGFGAAHFGGGLGMGRGLSHEGVTRLGGLGFHHHRSFGPDAWGPRCGDWLADPNPDCTLPN